MKDEPLLEIDLINLRNPNELRLFNLNLIFLFPFKHQYFP